MLPIEVARVSKLKRPVNNPQATNAKVEILEKQRCAVFPQNRSPHLGRRSTVGFWLSRNRKAKRPENFVLCDEPLPLQFCDDGI
jgi:hypothetical protein